MAQNVDEQRAESETPEELMRLARTPIFLLKGARPIDLTLAAFRSQYDTKRQVLYMACTRARDRLSISGVDPVSDFLDDVKG